MATVSEFDKFFKVYSDLKKKESLLTTTKAEATAKYPETEIMMFGDTRSSPEPKPITGKIYVSPEPETSWGFSTIGDSLYD